MTLGILQLWHQVTQRQRRKAVTPKELRISAAADGFGLQRTGVEDPAFDFRSSWEDVQKVVAFKRDCFTVDLLCLAIELPGPTTVELNEEMDGWQPFIESLHEHLEGLPPWHEWWLRVAVPAFKTNATVLFERPPSPASILEAAQQGDAAVEGRSVLGHTSSSGRGAREGRAPRS